jgi:uncharacterized protein YceK
MRAMGIKLIRNLLLMTLIVSLNGCMTCSTLDRAESKTHTDSQGQTVTDRQGRPANYVLLLIAVPADQCACSAIKGSVSSAAFCK